MFHFHCRKCGQIWSEYNPEAVHFLYYGRNMAQPSADLLNLLFAQSASLQRQDTLPVVDLGNDLL